MVEFDDGALAHPQIVIVPRFTAGRHALRSWLDVPANGDGRSGLWTTPHAPVHFTFSGSRAPAVDRARLEVLTRRANSGAGLVVCDAAGELLRATGRRRMPARS